MDRALVEMLGWQHSTVQLWLGSIDGNRFSRAIEPKYFYGAFAALCECALSVSEATMRTLLHYADTDLFEVVDDDGRRHWRQLVCAQPPFEVHRYENSRFDVRAKLTQEVAVDTPPPHVVRARSKAKLIGGNVFANEITRAGFARTIHRRQCRSLRLTHSWTAHFVVVDVAELRECHSNGVAEHVYHNLPTSFEINVECVERQRHSATHVLTDLRHTIHLLTTCLGDDDAHVDAHLADAQQLAEMRQLSPIKVDEA